MHALFRGLYYILLFNTMETGIGARPIIYVHEIFSLYEHICNLTHNIYTVQKGHML